MKLILPVLIVLTFISCKSKTNDLKADGLKGDISSITESTYDATEKFGEPQKGRLKNTSIYKLNTDGNTVENIYTSMPDTIIYDKITDNEDLSDGNNSAKDTIVNKKSVFTTYYIFNDKGQKIELKDSKNGPVKAKLVYDDRGKCVEFNTYDDNKKLSTKQRNTYDNNNLIIAKVYDADGSLKTLYKNKYDDAGKLLHFEELSNGNKSSKKYVYTRDGNGLIITEKRYDDNELMENLAFKYRDFDSKGNWLKRLEYQDGKIIKLTERSIQYR
ncbi:hypothetical protein KHS38_14385 [Mucilaginibacter sp. Bleaf8]|uniref:hypothetical protein n=1 Tax=Mucilaginibacter sp. Bleaf8 TaxID=2834430 RepID=UPI001BCA6EB7|nr:hypothetical protein [Mucilaginibacter sp. Bleaf8]MBS7565597.1 hypothetical protein [Mucilaginibacter sp. Bleaf8]